MEERKWLWIYSHKQEKAEIKDLTVLTVVSYDGSRVMGGFFCFSVEIFCFTQFLCTKYILYFDKKKIICR